MIHHTITDHKVASRLSLSLNLQMVKDRQGKPYFKSAFKYHLQAIQIQIYSSHAQNSTRKLKNSEAEVSLYYCKLHAAATQTVNE